MNINGKAETASYAAVAPLTVRSGAGRDTATLPPFIRFLETLYARAE
jgi:hypothetical protein